MSYLFTGLGRCEPGWELFGDSCYQINTNKKSWQAGNTACQNLGANLVSIHSAEEQSFLSGKSWMYKVGDS